MAIEEAIEIGAKALAEYHAPNSWDCISDELKDTHRREVKAILEAIGSGEVML